LLAFIARQFSSERDSFILLAAVLGCFTLWNFGFIFQWGAHLIPVRGPISWKELARNQVEVVPHQIAGQVKNFLFRRSEMMQKIEQRDIEQMKNAPAQ
jgi:hypothetical protein